MAIIDTIAQGEDGTVGITDIYIGETYEGELSSKASGIFHYRRNFIFCCKDKNGKKVETTLYVANYLFHAWLLTGKATMYIGDGIVATYDNMISFAQINDRNFKITHNIEPPAQLQYWLSECKVTESDSSGIWFRAEATWEFDPNKIYVFEPPKWKSVFKSQTTKLYVPYARASFVRDGDDVLLYRGLGYDGEKYNGVDVAATEWKVTCNYTIPYFPLSYNYYQIYLSWAKNTCNHAVWYGWQKSTVLFEGAEIAPVRIKHPLTQRPIWTTQIQMTFDLEPAAYNLRFDTSTQTQSQDEYIQPEVELPSDTPTYPEQPDVEDPNPNPDAGNSQPNFIYIPFVLGHHNVEVHYQKQSDGSTRVRQVDVSQIYRYSNFDFLGVPMS
jgi:hypothetical protein